MKKLLFLLLFTMPLFCNAQSDTTKYQPRVVYCTAEIYPYVLKYEVILDDGSQTKTSAMEIKDAKGKLIKFTSRIAALNYVLQQGWTIVSTYGITKVPNAIGFVLKRPVSNTGQ